MRYLLAALSVCCASQALASPVGEWMVKDRTARVAISTCGENLCGKLDWTADGNDVGQSILIDMKPDGARWTGTVVDVRNGRHYLAHVALKSENILKLDGCVLGGLFCGGEVWTRYQQAPSPLPAPTK